MVVQDPDVKVHKIGRNVPDPSSSHCTVPVGIFVELATSDTVEVNIIGSPTNPVVGFGVTEVAVESDVVTTTFTIPTDTR